MASTFISNKERTNFARMCWIVVDVFRDIFWHVLTLEISPADLPNKVQTNQHKLGNLNTDIKSWLCKIHTAPASPIIPTSKNFDVTSLYTLIRNLCSQIPIPTNGWGQHPPPVGGNVGDDVERVRVFRNAVYGHAKEGHVNNSDYNTLCSDMKTFVTNFDGFFGGSCNFVEMIESILTCSMDKALQDTYIDNMQEIAQLSDDMAKVKRVVGGIQKKLRDRHRKTAKKKAERRKIESSWKRDIQILKGTVDSLVKESIETKKQWDSLSKEGKTVIDKKEQQRIIDLSQMILEQHRSHAEKNFVETQAYRDANEMLRQHRRLIITGKSGQGKSYMACQLLNKIIANDSDIKPLIISTVEQWKTLVDSSITLGVIVDDMCEKFCLNEGELKKWREEFAYMPALIEKGKHVVIFTMKSFLYDKIMVDIQPKFNISRPLFSTEIILNLDNIRLKFEEKTEFANTYLKEFCLNDVEVSELCKIHEVPVGFPQLCRAAEMIKEKSRLSDLFSNPREMILEQMKHISLDDSLTYGCLALVLLSKGNLKLKLFRGFGVESEKKENIVISVFRSCGIPDVTPQKVVETLKSLKGTYLSSDAADESYSFVHDSIEEAVFISYRELAPEQTLLYCPLELICKHCTIKYDSNALETTPQNNALTFQPSFQAILIDRFITALKGGNPTDFAIVSEANIWSSKDFRKVFFAECKEIHFVADKDENSLLVHAANANNRDLVGELLHELDHIPEDKKKKVAQFLTKSAKASCAHKDTYLLEKICKSGGVDANDILPSTIQHGSVDAIEFLLQSGANVNYRSENGENLVHIACLHGRLDIVKLLHSRNANLVNEFDYDKRSVGQCVASGGSVEILEFLLPLGLNPLYTDPTGWNLLHYACWHGKKDMTEHLMDRHPNLLYSKTKEGFSVLFCAAFGGNLYIFKKIYELMEDSLKVDQSANENRTNDLIYLMPKTKDSQTLLHMTCLGGGLEITKYLVETYPTMLHEVDSWKRTPAHHAAYCGHVAVLRYLIHRGTDPWCRTSEEETLLHMACINGQFEMTKYMVETYPTMLHEVDNSKRTPAHLAAQSGNVAVLRYLIHRGADPRRRTAQKETLLHRACINGQLEMTMYLVETYPTMLHEMDNGKITPAHNAAVSGNVAVLSYLIDRGTDPWSRTSEEGTLLHSACINGQLKMTKYLLETYPTMLNELDKKKFTPAHHAVQSGNVAVLSYLIDRGADPWCRSCKEETFLHTACINGQLKMTKYLVETYHTMLHEVDKRKITPAHNAAVSGNVAILSYLIDRGTDPWSRTSEEGTLLHSACIKGQLEMTKYLLETYPTMLHEVDNRKRTPAHHAVQSGNVAVLSYLIDRGADPWCRSCEEETLLHRACINSQLEMTKYLVETYPTMLDEVDNSKRTPAHHAAHGGNVAVLTYLIDRGADSWCRSCEEETLLHRACINGQLEMTKYLVETYPIMLHEVDKRNSTPAHHAAHGGNVAVVSYLIDRGADPWFRTSEKRTLLHSACISGELEMTKYLVETYPTILHEVDNCKKTPAHLAAVSGNVAVLRYLIDRGADPWCRTSEEETLLHTACINSQLEMTKYLLETYPTMLHEVDNRKRTPANNAVQRGNVAVLSYLIDRGADPWCRTFREETLLHTACVNGQLEMTKYLVETYPTMLHEVDNMKWTPAHLATCSGNVDLLSYLIDRGTDPLCRTCEEETLLHTACIHGQLEMTKYLVEMYPRILHEVDNSKRTPAHNAAVSGNVDLLSYLIDRGADPWCRTFREETLLHRACLNGKLEMTKYLVETYPQMLHEVDNSKKTPVYCAVLSRNAGLVRYLHNCQQDQVTNVSLQRR